MFLVLTVLTFIGYHQVYHLCSALSLYLHFKHNFTFTFEKLGKSEMLITCLTESTNVHGTILKKTVNHSSEGRLGYKQRCATLQASREGYDNTPLKFQKNVFVLEIDFYKSRSQRALPVFPFFTIFRKISSHPW